MVIELPQGKRAMPRISHERRSFPNSVRALVDALGGTDTICTMFDISRTAVANWVAQNTVPARYHAVLLMVTERAGIYWRPPGWDPDVQLRYRPEVPPADGPQPQDQAA